MAELSTQAFNPETLAESLITLRNEGRKAPSASFALPQDLSAGMAAQNAVAQRIGANAKMIKVAMSTDKQPVIAPLFPYVETTSEAKLPYSPGTRFEVEIAVKLGADLPVRSEAYTRAEVLDAVADAYLGSELLVTAVEEGGSVSFPLYLADRIGNGGYALGPKVPKTLIDTVGGLTLKVTHDSSPVYNGPARHPVGDVLAWLVAYANDAARPATSLTSGMAVTTGALSGAMPLPGAGRVVVELEGGYQMSVLLSA